MVFSLLLVAFMLFLIFLALGDILEELKEINSRDDADC